MSESARRDGKGNGKAVAKHNDDMDGCAGSGTLESENKPRCRGWASISKVICLI